LLEPLDKESSVAFESVREFLLGELHDSVVMEGDVVAVMHYARRLTYRMCKVSGDVYGGAMHNMNRSESSAVANGNGLSKQNGILEDDICLPSKQLDEMDSMFHVLSVNTNENAPSKDVEFVYIFLSGVTYITIKVMQEHKHLNDTQPSQQHITNNTLLDKIGGLDSQLELLTELIALPFQYPSLYKRCGVHTPKGIIVHGGSGTGKTTLVHAFVNNLPNVYMATINGPELTSKFHGETEQKFRDVFQRTKSKSPSVLVIDEFDAVCAARTSASSEAERRVVATLLTLLDDINDNDLFAVVAITSKLDQIDLALRRPGRLDTEIEFTVPNSVERLAILNKLLVQCKHSLSDVDVVKLAEVTHGYVGSDLSALVKEAGMIAMKQKLRTNVKPDEMESLFEEFSITLDHFRSAMCNIRVSAMKAVVIDVPKVHWSDIGGQHEVKQRMQEAIEWPLKHPHVFKRLGIKPPRGLLMYGPPGCSKTLTAKALATESGLNFISIKGPELFNKYLGESEKAIRDVFHKARVSAPSIVFFDEIDAVGVQRSEKGGNNVADRVLAQLLTELDGVESLEGVIIIAATNRPDIIDPALLRPGRIDHLVYVPLPNEQTRREIFQIQFRTIPIASDVVVDDLVAISSGYSGAEICSLCREASMGALRENFDCTEVSMNHFSSVFEDTKPAVSAETVVFYENYKQKTSGSF